MTQYANFDHTQPSPQPVLAWYDTGLFNYATLPASNDLLELSSDQWNARMTGLWAVSAGTLVEYTPPTPTLTIPQQAVALQMAGLTITSSGDSLLNGTYACDADTQQMIFGEMISISTNSTFTDGETTVPWLDKDGTAHTFTIDQFKALVTAIAAFVTGCIRCIKGQSTSLPSNDATIP